MNVYKLLLLTFKCGVCDSPRDCNDTRPLSTVFFVKECRSFPFAGMLHGCLIGCRSMCIDVCTPKPMSTII